MKSIKHALLGLFGIAGLTISMFGLFKVPFAESAAKDYWRQALVAIILILMLIAGAISLFIYTFDANYFKARIVEYVKVHKQRDLVLEGDIKVTFFPKLGLNTGKMSLSERNSQKGFASIDNARLYIAWLPLLRKQLEVDRITLDGMHANVIRYKDGSSNFDDLLLHDGSLDSTKFDIDGVSISNSSINLQDESEGMHFALHDVHLETGRLTDTVPSNMTSTFRLEADKPHIATKVKLNSHLFFERKSGHYEFANFEGEMEGEAAGISNLALNFEGTLNGFPAVGVLTLDKFVATTKGTLNSHAFASKLDLPRLHLNKSKVSGNKLDFSATLTQADESLNAVLQIPAFDFNDKILQSTDVTAELNLKQPDRALQAKFNTPLSMNFENLQLQLSDISAKLVLTHPKLASALSIKASGIVAANFQEQEVKSNFSAKFDDSELAGSLAVANFRQAAYTFDISLNTLDIDRYLQADWSKRLYDDAAPLDFSGLNALKLRGSVRADELKFAKIKVSKLHAEMIADQSTLSIEPMSASLYEGTLSGSLSLSTRQAAKIVLKQKISAIQISQLLHDAAGESRLTGKGNIALDLSAEGNSIDSLRKNMTGNVTFAATRGSVAGINLPSALAEGKSLLGMPNGERSYPAKFTDLTSFTELRTSFDIRDGIARSSEFNFKSPLFFSKGEGRILLDSGNLEYRLDTTIAAGLKRQSNGELAELRGISLPMQLGGSYDAPAFTLNFGSASGGNAAKLIKANMLKAANTSAAEAVKAASQ